MKDLFAILFLVVLAWLIWRLFARKAVPAKRRGAPLSAEDIQIRHMRSTLEFAKAQHDLLSQKQREQDAWQQTYGHAKAGELDQLSGTEFEEFLAGLFRGQGYAVELTPSTGDYGADLILMKDGQRIAVQAKRYAGSVGVSALQEALSGQAYYKCQSAWVITTGVFTVNAIELATKSSVKLIGRGDLGILMLQVQSETYRRQPEQSPI